MDAYKNIDLPHSCSTGVCVFVRFIGTVTFAMNNCVFQIAMLGLASSLTVKDSVWGAMAKLMTNQLALTINWKVSNGKMPFGTLALTDVVRSKLGSHFFSF